MVIYNIKYKGLFDISINHHGGLQQVSDFPYIVILMLYAFICKWDMIIFVYFNHGTVARFPWALLIQISKSGLANPAYLDT